MEAVSGVATASAVAVFAKYYILDSFSQLGANGMQDLSWAQTGLVQTEAWGAGMSASDLLSTIDRDIIVLATPGIAKISAVVVGLVVAGGLAAALSTAFSLLLVISSSLAHDITARSSTPKHPTGSAKEDLRENVPH